jgi:Fe-S cluster biogenesis protein NfuA/nitrite reductase/ring-hydroxylating ferredoxin subunit
LTDDDAQERVARVEGRLEALDSLADPVAREHAMEMVQALLDLYGEGLARVMARLGDAEARALADDELVSHLLLLHDLHPVPLEQRVGQALEEVRPYLDSHGGGVQFVGVEDGVVRLRMNGSCDGCPSSLMTLKLAIEEAIQRSAPEIERVEAEGVSEPAPTPLLQLAVTEAVGGPGPSSDAAPPEAWTMAGTLTELPTGGTAVKRVAGEELLFVRLEDTYYAYRPGCPGCRAALGKAWLERSELVCAGCGRRYDVRRAGRCLDEPDTWLDPLPLLLDDSGLVRVALGSAVA